MNTNKGCTGQYADPLTGFDYYNARYYDPVCGTFLSADPVEGNMQGMNPYAYVGGNPETMSDPTGNMYAPPGGGGGGSGGNGGGGTPPPPPPSSPPSFWQQAWNVTVNVSNTFSTIGNDMVVVAPLQAVNFLTGATSIYGDAQTLFDSRASGAAKWAAAGDLALNVGMDALMVTGIGEEARGGELALKGGGVIEDIGEGSGLQLYRAHTSGDSDGRAAHRHVARRAEGVGLQC